VIYVGDAHPAIYAWRGAVNAMQQLPLHESRLTTSFRFGDAIADVANAC
jgi:L-asparaginase II